MFLVNKKNQLKRVLSLPQVFVVMGVGLIGLDQATKMAAETAGLMFANYGGVLGIWPSSWWIVILAVVWWQLVRYWRKVDDGITALGLGLIVVGGLSNLIDRAFWGYVRDFIYYSQFGFYGNLADVYLFVGAVIVCFRTLYLWPQAK